MSNNCLWCDKPLKKDGTNRKYCNEKHSNLMRQKRRQIKDRMKYEHYNPKTNLFEYKCLDCELEYTAPFYNTPRCKACAKVEANRKYREQLKKRCNPERRAKEREGRRRRGECKEKKTCYRCNIELVGVPNATRYCATCKPIVLKERRNSAEFKQRKAENNKRYKAHLKSQRPSLRSVKTVKKNYDEKVEFKTTKKNIQIKKDDLSEGEKKKLTDSEMIEKFLKKKKVKVYDTPFSYDYSMAAHGDNQGGLYISGRCI